MDSARVATWNICCTPDGQGGRLDQIVERLAGLQPDVVCLQEAWQGAMDRIAGALGMHVAAHTEIDRHDGPQSDVAILTRWWPINSHQQALPGLGDNGQATGYVNALLKDDHGAEWVIHSAHLAWGSRAELVRARQAVRINRCADELHTSHPDATQVLTGDFNALPHSLTLRYLTGLDHVDGETALWVDAWDKVGDGPGWTSDPLLPQSVKTAHQVGIQCPELLPQRRIDYVMAHGYAHGRPGCPMSAQLIPGDGASDHHGIVVEVWRGNRP